MEDLFRPSLRAKARLDARAGQVGAPAEPKVFCRKHFGSKIIWGWEFLIKNDQKVDFWGLWDLLLEFWEFWGLKIQLNLNFGDFAG